jgi:anti-anti-sigma factor
LLDPAAPEAFTIGVEFFPDRTLLWAAGELDRLTVGPLAEQIDAHLLDPEVPVAVLDLRGISFVDCRAAGMLVEKAARARSLGIELRLVPGRALRRLDERLGSRAFLTSLGVHIERE